MKKRGFVWGIHAVAWIAWVLTTSTLHAQESPHGDLKIACQDCHVTTSWKELASPLKFDHSDTRFPLQGQHEAVSCAKCHGRLRFTGTSPRCIDCHTEVHRGELGASCDRCHTSGTWLVPDMAQRHASTRFPLVGSHMTVPCGACHVNQQKHEFVGLPTDCFGCHRAQYEATMAPPHRASGIGTDCVQCHAPTAATWGSGFNHAQTSFPLTGAHGAVPCLQCHQGTRFRGTPVECVSCHRTDAGRVAEPRHVPPSFSDDCTACHSPMAWKPSSFNHDATRYRLTGAHLSATCSSCHINGVYTGTSVTCAGCHLQHYDAAVSPKHTQPSFSLDCTLCHSTTGWRPATFDHSITSYPLTGNHRAVACVSCHAAGTYRGTTTHCVGCHQADYTSATAPNHVAAGFPTDCTVCHSTNGWKPSTFNHAQTQFPLTGAHSVAACSACHVNGVYAGTVMTCIGCHQQDYNGTFDPSHVTAGFPTQCETCHSTTAWRPSSYDHAKTQFPLTGAHLAVQCVLCHPNNRYRGTPVQCSGCHTEQYNGVVSPRHVQPSFSLDCTVCHTTSAWKPSSFNHAATSFALTGAHVSAACASCHINAVYAGTATTCVGCHQQEFNATTNPNHVTSGFPTECRDCHTTSVWRPATFDHARTQFPLTGAHLAVPCTQCHVNGQYQGTPLQCAGCHQSDYDVVASPKHTQPSFSLNCTACHTTTAWKPSSFNHGTTRFTLTGAHTGTPCAACHVNGVYVGTPMTCVGCHQQDYNASVDPNHASAGFPTDCQTCHSTTAWKPSSWNHDTFFPISAGSTHRPGRWNVCGDCHTVQTNFKVFSCVTCHEHNQAEMNSKHTGVANYAYESSACYRCHPRGSE